MRTECEIHGRKYWSESFPPGAGFCRECIRISYDNAPRCPHCGDKVGFSWGTGDCGCDPDPE